MSDDLELFVMCNGAKEFGRKLKRIDIKTNVKDERFPSYIGGAHLRHGGE